MVISTYQKSSKLPVLWYSGQIMGVSVAYLKIAEGGPWIIVRDLGQGKYKITHKDGLQHGELPEDNEVTAG